MENLSALPLRPFFSPSPNLRKQSIVLIDDCRSILEFHKTLLELEHYEVLTAESGAEALTLLSHISSPDLILLDMQMDGMDGIEFLIQLEKNQPYVSKNVPVVFLTSLKSVPESKAIGCIQKPTNAKKFITSVRHYIDMEVPKHSKTFSCTP
ncbi:MAG: response regulator [Bdellovibrionota bacterium]